MVGVELAVMLDRRVRVRCGGGEGGGGGAE